MVASLIFSSLVASLALVQGATVPTRLYSCAPVNAFDLPMCYSNYNYSLQDFECVYPGSVSIAGGGSGSCEPDNPDGLNACFYNKLTGQLDEGLTLYGFACPHAIPVYQDVKAGKGVVS